MGNTVGSIHGYSAIQLAGRIEGVAEPERHDVLQQRSPVFCGQTRGRRPYFVFRNKGLGDHTLASERVTRHAYSRQASLNQRILSHGAVTGVLQLAESMNRCAYGFMRLLNPRT